MYDTMVTGMKGSKTAMLLPLLLMLALAGCMGGGDVEQQQAVPTPNGEYRIGTAQELASFFEGGPAEAWLATDIDLGGEMLTLTAARGPLTLHGDGHTLRSAAPALIRMEDGCALTLSGITLDAAEAAIGMLGGGRLGGNARLSSCTNCVHAAGDVIFAAAASLMLASGEGTGLIASSVLMEEGSRLTVDAAIYALNIGRGGVTLASGAELSCVAKGDNILNCEGELTLAEAAKVAATNSGEHNAVRALSISAAPGARLEAVGGANGIGLFLVEQQEDITLSGFSRPAYKQESGPGSVTFIK